MLHEDVCLMTAHTRPALHKWICLQLGNLIGVTGLACVQARLACEVLCRGLAMANGAVHTVIAMRAGFPLVINRLMAVDTRFPGRKQPMHNMRGLILLSSGRLHGSSRKKKYEQGGAEHARAETIHGKVLLSDASHFQTGEASQSVIRITSHRTPSSCWPAVALRNPKSANFRYPAILPPSKCRTNSTLPTPRHPAPELREGEEFAVASRFVTRARLQLFCRDERLNPKILEMYAVKPQPNPLRLPAKIHQKEGWPTTLSRRALRCLSFWHAGIRRSTATKNL